MLLTARCEVLGEERFPIVFVVLGPGGYPTARAVVARGSQCPELKYLPNASHHRPNESEHLPVRIRVEGDDELPYAFPVRVCEADLPKGLPEMSMTFGDRVLPPIPANPSKYVLIGDTGLRVKPKNTGDCLKHKDSKLYGVHQCEVRGSFDETRVNGAFQSIDYWPAQSIMDAAAVTEPDVVVH